jgi:ABC-type bacteriocin/lantibiotic exporter with double-glycine peptidase domain
MPANFHIPQHKQSRPGACLPACARMVLAYLGDERDEESIAHLLEAEWYGVPASRIIRLSAWGYHITYEQSTLEQLRQLITQQIPVIIFLRTGALPDWNEDVPHAIVLVGLTDDSAHIHDPVSDSGPTPVDLNAFLLAWSDMDYTCATIQKKNDLR